jgi:hypothetical protein
MSWTTPRTWSACEVVTATLLNTHVRDNLNECAPAKFSTKGDSLWATAANTTARLGVGTDGGVLCASSGCNVGVRWASGQLDVNFSASLVDVNNRLRVLQAASTFGEITLGGFQTDSDWRMLWDDGSGNGLGNACSLQFWYGLTRKIVVGNAAAVIVNDDGNSFMTTGLTINQGTTDDEIIALKSSDVAHGITDLTETDTYGAFRKAVGDNGGLLVVGYSDTSAGTAPGIELLGRYVTDTTTKTTAAQGAVVIAGEIKSGTGVTNPGANANVLAIQAGANTRFIFDADGDLHADAAVSASAYDAWDDAALLRRLDVELSDPATVIDTQFKDWMKYGRADLERAKLVTFNDDGHHFVNYTRLSRAQTGAIWQQRTRIGELEQENAELRGALLALAAHVSAATGCAFALPAGSASGISRGR